jgi:hypothetical protein
MAELSLVVFLKASILFSKVVVPVYIPPAVYEGSFFTISTSTFVGGGVLHDSCSNRSEVES